MFLLILEPAPGTGHINNFTFHNVSINTPKADIYVAYNTSLHSTMFLLIRIPETQDLLSGSVFTFHNVSINTGLPAVQLRENDALHSTMFLLIPEKS